MGDIDLDAIEARANAATPGPWDRVPQTRGGDLIAHRYETGNQMNPTGLRMVSFMMSRGNSLKEDEANADFVSSARTDIPALVAEVRRLREQLREAERTLNDNMQTYDNESAR